MRRRLIGIIALVLILGAVVFWFWPPQTAGFQQLEAACWRVGALMAVLWLAYDEVARLPGWMLAAIPLLALILALRPKWFLIALPIILVLALLKFGIRRSG